MTLPPNFSFVWQKLVAGSAHPGNGPHLVGALASLREAGVLAILSLTEEPLDFPPIREFEMDYLHLPVDDFTAPGLSQVQEAVRFIDEHAERGEGTLVHCRAGIGRTGTMLACFLVGRGFDPAQAIQQVRQLRPGSLEVYSQEYCVYQYAKHLRGEEATQGDA